MSLSSSFEHWRIIDLPKIHDPRGNLTFVEGGRHIPFEIRRVFYLYDVPGGESRAGHALKDCEQLLIAVAGSFSVTLDSGEARQTVLLNRSHVALYIPPLVWREIDDFTSGAVCLVLASSPYDEAGYFRTYDDFLAEVKGKP